MSLSTHRKKAISVVLTTMIILVASVVLATAVTIYGTSLFQQSSQQEVISIKGIRIWVNATDANGVTWGAAGVRNAGDKLVSVDTIQVRGTSIPFTNMYVDTDAVRVTNDNFLSQFNYTGTNNAGVMLNSTTAQTGTACPSSTPGPLVIDQDGAGAKPRLCLTQASGPTSLRAGDKLVVYFRVPDGIITTVDSGTPTNVGIFAGKTGAPITAIIRNQ